MIRILSGVTAVLCAENPLGGTWGFYLLLSCRKACPANMVPEHPHCRPMAPCPQLWSSLTWTTEPWHQYKTQFAKAICYTILSVLLSAESSTAAQRCTEAPRGQTAVGADHPPSSLQCTPPASSPGFPATRNFSEVKIPLQYVNG